MASVGFATDSAALRCGFRSAVNTHTHTPISSSILSWKTREVCSIRQRHPLQTDPGLPVGGPGYCHHTGAWRLLMVKVRLMSLSCFCLEAADSVPAHKGQELTHMIQGLQPFTVYGAAVACRGASGVWSDWSLDVSGRTRDRGDRK